MQLHQNFRFDSPGVSRVSFACAVLWLWMVGLHAPTVSGQNPGVSGQNPGVSGQAPGVSGQAPGVSGQAPGVSGQAPGDEDAPAKNPPAQNPPPRYWDSDWSFDDVDVGKLLDRLERFGLVLPVDVSGDVTVRFKVGVPITRLTDTKAYRVSGSIKSPKFTIGTLQLEAFSSSLAYRNGSLSFEKLSSRIIDADSGASGRLLADGQWQLAGTTQLQLRAAMDQIPVQPITRLIAKTMGDPSAARWARQLGGRLSGQVAHRSSGDQWADPAQWQTRGTLQLDSFSQAGSEAIDIQVENFELDRGRWNLPEATLKFQNQSSNLSKRPELRIRGDGRLGENGAFRFRVLADDVSLEDLPGLALAGNRGGNAPLVSGSVDLDLSAQGQWQNDKMSEALSQIQLRGRIASPQLRVLGQDLGTLEHRIEITPGSVRVNPIDAEVRRDRFRIVSAELDWSEQPGAWMIENIQIKLDQGTLVGDAQVATEPDRKHRVRADWKQVRLRLDPSPWLGASWLGASANDGWSIDSSGAIDWSVPYASLADPSAHQGSFDWNLRSLRIGGETIAAADLQIESKGETLRVRGEGALLGGTFSIDGQTRTTAGADWTAVLLGLAGTSVRISEADVDSIVPMLVDSGRDSNCGKLSANLRIAQIWPLQMGGRVHVRDGCVMGFPIASVQSSVDLGFAGPSRWSAAFSRLQGRPFGGRLDGHLEIASVGSGRGIAIDSELSCRHLDFGQLLAQTGITSSLARGKISGSVQLGGRRVQDLGDLRGRFNGELSEAGGRAIPGLVQSSRFFAGLSLANLRFSQGTIVGSIGGGQANIEDFQLLSSQLAVSASGNVALRDGRMNLIAKLETGNFALGVSPLVALGSRVAIDSVLPGATLVEVARWASYRTVFVDVIGPPAQPIVRLRPVDTAAAAAKRLVVEQLVPNLTGSLVD
ncbi:MAG: AsmA-like C-terminal region-containing protein [Planctomycetota bacterium]